MNFTREIKRELIRKRQKDRFEAIPFLAAVLKTSGSFKRDKISFTSENEEVSSYLLELFESVGIHMTLAFAERDPKHGRDKLSFSSEGNLGAALREFEPKEELEKREYIKGAFLGSGSCTLPSGQNKTGYHLEFIFSIERDALRFLSILEEFELIASVLKRGEKFVVYLKSSEAIADLLSVMEAFSSLSRLEAVAFRRQLLNDENRMSNCYAFNADKSAIASAEQVLALQKMQKEGKFASLSEPLKETATARLLNPELSLKELAEKLNISKSCLFHRLKKLMTLGKENE